MPLPVKSLPKVNPLWFTPICDEVHRKIAIWNQAYNLGEVHSTRQWLNPKSGSPEDMPTRFAHKIPLRQVELEHLIRITESLRPGSTLLDELKEIQSVWRYGKPIQGYRFNYSYWSKIQLPAGLHRAMTLAFYPEHVKEILDLLTEAKTGQKAASADALISAKKTEGKDLFEE